MVILAGLLSSLYFTNNYIDKYRENIEQFVSKTIKQPITIGNISIGNYGLEPILRLHDVVIFNDDNTRAPPTKICFFSVTPLVNA